MVTIIEITVYWAVTACSFIFGNLCFGGTVLP